MCIDDSLQTERHDRIGLAAGVNKSLRSSHITRCIFIQASVFGQGVRGVEVKIWGR